MSVNGAVSSPVLPDNYFQWKEAKTAQKVTTC